MAFTVLIPTEPLHRFSGDDRNSRQLFDNFRLSMAPCRAVLTPDTIKNCADAVFPIAPTGSMTASATL